MKRILLVYLFLNFVLLASSKIIKINISGNKNVSIEKILTLIKVKEGNEFDENLFKKDIESLIKTGYFKEVNYYVEKKEIGLELNIYLKENPIIEKIIFEGNKVFKTKKLKEIFGVKEGDILNEEKVIEGVEKIRELYYKKGFQTSEIEYKVETFGEKCILKVEILERPKDYVKEILFEGNNSFKDRKLKKLMKIKERRMPFIKGTYKEDTLNEDINRIKNFYNENGFIEAKVEKEIEYDKRGLIIKILINEGKRFFVGEIKLEGDLIFKEEEIRKNILMKRGDIFNTNKNEQSIKNIYQLYANNGYIKCNVECIPEMKGQTINLTYFINPGSVYFAEEIKIKGNKITKDKVIRREIKLEPGDKITGDKVNKSFSNLRDTNYFENIQIYPEIIEEGKANIVVNVKEREKTGLFLIGGGYSSIDKFIGMVSIQQTNFDITNPPKFVGGGQNFSLLFEMGTISRNYKLSFTEPYLFDKPIYFGPDIYRLRKEWDTWTETSSGFDLRFGKKWENFTLGFKFLTENVELEDVDIPSLKITEGEKRKNSITTYLTYSKLDSERFPSQGDKIKISLEYAGIGGDIDFLKTTLENNFYYPFKNIIFHSKTYIGYINKDLVDIPIYERFFGGGIGSVRGYKERTLGPREDGYYLGGNFIFAQNFEILYPLYKDVLYGIGFFDIGNVYEEWDGLSNLKKGIGAGVRVNIPFLNAPIEIYYGYALDAEKGESKSRIHIGMSFGF
ncbi:MAG: outer membrane protein assembly factor BamA [Candidatus Omnitrophica bacterium]|nr:outer membrane protein assembly factor BamA [Candidatus Omnitrophota bacterium]